MTAPARPRYGWDSPERLATVAAMRLRGDPMRDILEFLRIEGYDLAPSTLGRQLPSLGITLPDTVSRGGRRCAPAFESPSQTHYREQGGIPCPVDAPAPDPPSTQEQIREEQRQRRLTEAERTAKEMGRIAANRADLIDEIRRDVEHQPVIYVQPPRPDRSPRKPRSLILFLSDVHVGQLAVRSDLGGLGGYDLGVYEERIGRVADKTLAIADDLRAGGPVDHLVIVFGGDIIDGRDIHPGHDHQSIPMGAQLRRGSEIMARRLMAPLASGFPRITCYQIPGNHGRIGRKGQLTIAGDSLDLVFGDYLKFRCEGMGNIEWRPQETWFAHFTLHGHAYFAAHGDAFKSWAGTPFYGATRYMGRIQSMLHRPIDALLVGHHHSPASFGSGHSNIVMNGSVVGTGSFGSWLGFASPPVQKLILSSADYAAATVYDLILASRAESLTEVPDDLDTLDHDAPHHDTPGR